MTAAAAMLNFIAFLATAFELPRLLALNLQANGPVVSSRFE
jgi:hypothetical protein